MVRNTVGALDEHQSMDVIVDVVGAEHVKGMAKLLVENHGFYPITLEEVPKSPE